MASEQKRTPGAEAAARVILRQIELLVKRPLDDKPGTLDGIAAVIDLHAAAPDLLAACEAIVALADGQGQRNMLEVSGQARAALAKAEGK